ncbi:MAG: DMT family transporter [Gammaproteobacteria bacterium]|jgi:drug/metabolite transporter (DMT)-like permease
MALDAKTLAPEKASLLAYAFLTTTALCWGANAIFGRLAVGEVSPMLLVSLRWFGVLLLLAVLARRQVARNEDVLKTHWRYLAVMGALGFTAFNAVYYVAAHTTTAVNIGIIQGGMPMFVFIGAFLVYRTPVSIVQVLGAIVTMSGVVIVASRGSLERLSTFDFAEGDLLILIACAIYSGYTVALRNRPQVPALVMFAALAGAAFAASLPLVAVEAVFGTFVWPTTTGWIIVGLTAIFPSVIAQTCFIKGVELIGPGRAGVFINLVPIFASIMAVGILAEAFRPYHALALVLVLGGIALSERSRPRGA